MKRRWVLPLCLFSLIQPISLWPLAASAKEEVSVPDVASTFLGSDYLADEYFRQHPGGGRPAKDVKILFTPKTVEYLPLKGIKGEGTHFLFVSGTLQVSGDDKLARKINSLGSAFVLENDGRDAVPLRLDFRSEEGCEDPELSHFWGEEYPALPSGEKLVRVDEQIKGAGCAGDRDQTRWTDAHFIAYKDGKSRALFSLVIARLKETYSYFPESDGGYVSGISYLHTDVISVPRVWNDGKHTASPLEVLKVHTVIQEGIVHPKVRITDDVLKWDPASRAFRSGKKANP